MIFYKGARLRCCLIAAWLSVAGCSNTELPEKGLTALPYQQLLDDRRFPLPAAGFSMVAAPDFLSLPETYREELDRLVASIDSEQERYRALRRWVYRKFDGYEFDVTATYSLAQLNNNRKINCLSFSVLFVAAARYVNVPAEFQLVFAPPYWDRQNNSWINNQHINVTGQLGSQFGVSTTRNGSVVTSYYNLDPGSSLAWNNLGVLYNRVGQSELAMQAYQRAIVLDESALSAKSNLARLYAELGMASEAAGLEQEVARFRTQNPYFHAARAEEQLLSGNLDAARLSLESAIERKHNEFYFYHQLARVNQQAGDREAMLENLRLARRHARGEDKTRFSGKLERLQELLGTN